MSRNAYNLSHLSHKCYDIGRIQCLTIIPVEAGCSLELSIDGIARLAPNRKEIVSECQVDIVAFHVPHRIGYGLDKWINFIKLGANPRNVSTFTGLAVAAGARNPAYLCLNQCGSTINRALVQGYNSIWYNYFAVPSYTFNSDNIQPNNDFTWYPNDPTEGQPDERCRKYGRLAARLPHVLNGGNMIDASGQSGWEAQSIELPDDAQVPVDTTGGTFSIFDLAAVKARYKSQAAQAWFSHFFQDIMDEKWGTSVSKDADPSNIRPTMLMRTTRMMSGTDVDGTDDATLGTFQGKTLERINFRMPRKLFAEHGNVYVMALFRYPLVHNNEAHPLLQVINPSYKQIAADVEVVANEPPQNFAVAPWIAGAPSFVPNNAIKEPYGQHYRFQNNTVHPNFQDIPGYPFTNFDGGVMNEWYYYQNNEYKDTFQTTQIGQAQTHCLVSATKYSMVPGISSSIYAGT